MPQPVQTVPATVKRIFNPDVKNINQTLIMDQIIKTLRARKVRECEINLQELAVSLSNLIPRMTKAVMEMIIEYKVANPEAVQIMGKKDATPYNGHYDPAQNTTSFDLLKLPDSLVIILNEFINLMERHAK